jgi:hypothetical protein
MIRAEDECAIVADALLMDLVPKRWSIEYGGMQRRTGIVRMAVRAEVVPMAWSAFYTRAEMG